MGDRRSATIDRTITATRPWLLAASAAIVWSVFTMTVLHIVSSHDPLRDTISSYATTNDGGGMLEASMLSMALGSLLLFGALHTAGVSLTRTAKILLTGWSIGLTTAALFPASFDDKVDAATGRIHQYACLVAFLSLPGVGASLAERLHDFPALQRIRAALGWATRIAVGALVLFAVSYVLARFPEGSFLGDASAWLPVGVTQRIALVADLAMLGCMIMLAAQAARIREIPELAAEQG